MPFETIQEIRQGVIDTLPETGEVEYNEFVSSLYTAGNVQAPAQLLKMKRDKLVKLRLDFTGSAPALFVSRVGGGS